jgi:hypothetical protein
MLNNSTYSDIIFQVENQKINSHRVLLISRSETFRNLFLEKKLSQNFLVPPVINFSSFMFLLEIIYSNEIWIQPPQR